MTLLSNDANENIELMKKLCLDGTIFGELTFCQAVLEGGLRNSPPSELALKYCNLFGMKPGFIRTGTATPGVVELPTNEYVHNVGMVKVNQPFLSNLSVEDSVAQHKHLLTGLSLYDNLFNAKTFNEAAETLLADGYATDIAYSKNLIQIHDHYLSTGTE